MFEGAPQTKIKRNEDAGLFGADFSKSDLTGELNGFEAAGDQNLCQQDQHLSAIDLESEGNICETSTKPLLKERIFYVFDNPKYEQPLQVATIVAAIEHDGFGTVEKGSVYCQLSDSVKRQHILRLARGKYASLDFDVKSYDLELDISSEDKLVALINGHGQPIETAQATIALNEQYNTQLYSESVSKLLTKAYRDKRIQRLQRGVYASLDFKDCYYAPPLKNSLSGRISKILEEAQKGMEIDEIVEVLNKASKQQVKRTVVADRLVKDYSKKRIRRPARGVYASRSFEGTYEAVEKMDISWRIIRALEKKDRAMGRSEIIDCLENDGLDAVTLGSVRKYISLLYRTEKIQRLDQGIYAHLKFDATKYKPKAQNEPLKTKSKSQLPVVKKKPASFNKSKQKKAPKQPATKRKPKTENKKAEAALKPENMHNVSIGVKIPAIINAWGGDTSIEEVSQELKAAGYKNLDSQNTQALIASVLQRKRRLLGFKEDFSLQYTTSL